MNFESYFELAKQTAKNGDIKKAKEYFAQYENMQSEKLVLYLDGAEFYKSFGEHKTAIEYYEKFLELDNTKSVIYTITADLYAKTYGDKSLDKQLQYYLRAFELKPDNRLTLHCLAFIYEKLGQNTQANKFYELIMQNNPTEIDIYNYGMFLIHCGNLYEGHKYITHRFNINDINLKYPSNVQKWDFKTDLSDKTLLIHYEQGFGDTIMYCRFVPFMKNFAKKIVFVVQEELETLIKNSPLISSDIEIVTNEICVNADYSIALLDLPYVLKIQACDIPFSEGYLLADKPTTLVKNNKKIAVGIAYSGDKSANYVGRDLNLTDFKFLTDIDKLQVYSFQKSETQKTEGIILLGNKFKSFSDTAEALKSMDLVISTDNVILNLAGALGVKTIALFNKETNFRWFNTKGDNTSWYKSIKPLQNTKQNDWRNSFKTIFDILNKVN